MSRSGYSDNCDGWDLIMWRGAVASAMRGKRGQAFLREMLAALDALPEKRLAANELIEEGEVCAMGAVGKARGIEMTVDPENREGVANLFGIAPAMAREIAFVNDDDFSYRAETPEARYVRVRKWIVEQIKQPAIPEQGGL